jgi:molybdopterin-guanine dinucleotide biosynthesis protein A
MGQPKAALDWHGQPLLARVAGVLACTLDGPIVVVRAPGQELPSLPAGVELAEDAREGRGPLEGIASGLRAIGDRADRAYVSSTDVPLLQGTFVTRVADGLDDGTDAAVPRVGGHAHPLAAVYRTALLPRIEASLERDRLRVSTFLEGIDVRWLDADWLLADPALAAADPELDSLRNLNEPADYEVALASVPSQKFGDDPGERKASQAAPYF